MANDKDLDNRETLVWTRNDGPLKDFLRVGMMFGYKYFIEAYYETDFIEVAAICRDEKELTEIFYNFCCRGMFCRVDVFVAKYPLDFELN